MNDKLIELTEQSYEKIKRKYCCQTLCKDCPYVPQGLGDSRLQRVNVTLFTQIKEISPQNAHNKTFRTLPDVLARVERLQNMSASRDDIRSYFNQYYEPPKE